MRVGVGIALLLLLVAFYGIAGRKRAEAELRIAAIAFEMQDAMIITDADQVILRVNQALTRITGYSVEEAVGQTPALLKYGHQDAQFYQAMWKCLAQDGYWQSEIWNRRKDGDVYPERITITVEQLAFLQDKGCDAYQGYLKSKSIPADEFARLL